jgi:tetratricopeptide (TPR) repeat protein
VHVLDEVIEDFTWEFSEHTEIEIPGLLAQEGVTPIQLRDLFKAAAQFYLASPWNKLKNLQPLAIQVPQEPQPRIVVVLGYAGMEYGLNVFQAWDEFVTFVSQVDDIQENIPAGGLLALHFADASHLPSADLKDIKRFRWQVINKQNYPIPMIFNPDRTITRPDRQDLNFLAAALLAIPTFLEEHLKPDQQGDYHPAQAAFPVDAPDDKKEIKISYPAGELAHKDLPSTPIVWESDPDLTDNWGIPGMVDLRAMEGKLGFFSEEFADQNVNRAQNLMYQAWDEENPAKRLILARQALSVSADCADAYVLLAEEESDTQEKALNLYKKGVSAGERALGKNFFQENESQFWGLLITRPYMRARSGLALSLWEMDRREEALDHYREMLRLNPMDNQGNRYLLLLLLMELDRGDEADALLAEHEDDCSAEWSYTNALRLFRVEGQSEKAAQTLTEALDHNPHVPSYLLGQKRIPPFLPPGIIIGEESEAVNYAFSYLSVWRQTPGALDWLKAQLD